MNFNEFSQKVNEQFDRIMRNAERLLTVNNPDNSILYSNCK